MVAATPGFVPGPSDPLTVKTYDLFFAAIRLFLEHGVTHVAEAAFQHENWVRGLEPLLPLATRRGLSVARSHLRLRVQSRTTGTRPAQPSCTRRHWSLQRGTAV